MSTNDIVKVKKIVKAFLLNKNGNYKNIHIKIKNKTKLIRITSATHRTWNYIGIDLDNEYIYLNYYIFEQEKINLFHYNKLNKVLKLIKKNKDILEAIEKELYT